MTVYVVCLGIIRPSDLMMCNLYQIDCLMTSYLKLKIDFIQ